MRVLFMGTSAFAVPTLTGLLDSDHDVAAVVTQPDRPRGRGLRPAPSAIKEVALKHEVPVMTPDSLRDEAAKRELTGIKSDLIVVAAYGKILPAWLLEAPRHGAINVHASLLPKYRGAAPIQRAIMAGERETGVTVMQMDEGLDTGAIILDEKIEIGPEETAGELEVRLAELGADLALKAIGLIERAEARAHEQVGEASHAEKVGKEEARISWAEPAEGIHNLVRALNPHPGAYAEWRRGRLKVWRSRVVEEGGEPEEVGRVLAVGSDSLVVGCGDGRIALVTVQPENRGRMSGAEFVRGYRLKVGDRLD